MWVILLNLSWCEALASQLFLLSPLQNVWNLMQVAGGGEGEKNEKDCTNVVNIKAHVNQKRERWIIEEVKMEKRKLQIQSSATLLIKHEGESGRSWKCN